MPSYRVVLTSGLSTVIEVEADDADDAIEKAYDSDQMPRGICAQCSGWGQAWSMDDSGEWEPDVVEGEDGTVVWERDPILTPQERVEKAERDLTSAQAALAREQKAND